MGVGLETSKKLFFVCKMEKWCSVPQIVFINWPKTCLQWRSYSSWSVFMWYGFLFWKLINEKAQICVCPIIFLWDYFLCSSLVRLFWNSVGFGWLCSSCWQGRTQDCRNISTSLSLALAKMFLIIWEHSVLDTSSVGRFCCMQTSKAQLFFQEN